MSDISSATSTCSAPKQFSCGVRIGHIFIVQSACLSLLACVFLLSYIAFNALRNTFKPPSIGQERWYFLRTAVEHYLLSMFVGDILMSLGSVMHIRWISIAGLEEGFYCTTQAAIKQAGDVIVALSAMCIAIHTFLVLFLRCRLPRGRLMPLTALALVWLVVVLITVIPSQIHKNAETPYYGKTVYWCSIDEQYMGERIGLLWGIFFLAAAVNIVLYVPLFLVLRGNIFVHREHMGSQNGRPRLRITWQRVRTGHAWSQHKEKRDDAAVHAKSMLAYPIVYIILITPLAIVRFIPFAKKTHSTGEEHSTTNVKVPYAWTAFSAVVFNSSGWVNVLLYAITRPSLFPWFKRSGESSEGKGDRQLDATNAVMVNAPTTGSQPATPHHANASPLPRIPVPMLADEDDDNDSQFKTSNSSTSYGLTPAMPEAISRNSRASKGSEAGYRRSASVARTEV